MVRTAKQFNHIILQDQVTVQKKKESLGSKNENGPIRSKKTRPKIYVGMSKQYKRASCEMFLAFPIFMHVNQENFVICSPRFEVLNPGRPERIEQLNVIKSKHG